MKSWTEYSLLASSPDAEVFFCRRIRDSTQRNRHRTAEQQEISSEKNKGTCAHRIQEVASLQPLRKYVTLSFNAHLENLWPGTSVETRKRFFNGGVRTYQPTSP
jgi:hypothetical protein